MVGGMGAAPGKAAGAVAGPAITDLHHTCRRSVLLCASYSHFYAPVQGRGHLSLQNGSQGKIQDLTRANVDLKVVRDAPFIFPRNTSICVIGCSSQI